MSPPPPTPWIDRPTRSSVKLLAAEAVIAPTVKSPRANKRTGVLPNIWDKEAHVGWKTVDVRRNDVPVLIHKLAGTKDAQYGTYQNASIADPLSFRAIDY